ncbi:phosphoribosylamine--glycine ligase [candidate division WOR-3 bacterium]|nr:phosphoribosylamine--glycine ligase [candidate division WOR-3 bacterium]
MKIMIVGGGGREHALGWALVKSFEGRDFYFVPGNGGTITIGHNVENLKGYDEIVRFAKEKEIDFTVVGPEKPLVSGIVDKFREEGLSIFGPTKEAAQLEGSKAFAKELMKEAHVPTASFEIFDDFNAAKSYIEKNSAPFAVKADGLAGGKGAFVCSNVGEGIKALELLMQERKFGEAGDTVVIEDCLKGQEVSVHALVSGDKIYQFMPAQDHKRAYDGDRGPNTGGMGAYAPVPFLGKVQLSEIKERIFLPTIVGLEKRGIEYKGVLYAGLMITRSGPKVLEFNVRFGDPEIQVILPLLNEDFLELLLRTNEGDLPDGIAWSDQSAVGIVVASDGYPGKYETGFEIVICDNSCILFHAGTRIENRVLYTDGGRVLSVVGVDRSLKKARDKTYKCIEKIKFTNMYYRKDIGDKGIKP